MAGIFVLAIAGCAGSPLGQRLEQSLEADPQLEESPAFGLEASTPTNPPSAADSTARDSATPSTATSSSTTVSASKPDDAAPRPGDPDFIGPVPLAQGPNPSAERRPSASTPDLAGVPTDLHAYVNDLAALEVLPLPAELTDSPPTANGDAPFSQPISRREYARWLFLANNTFYEDVANQRIRAGTQGDEPAFQDVAPADPDFDAIQGLAKAGIIPSTLSGNGTATNFRPDAPLTRETLVLWKVPLDIHRGLPATTPEAVAERWGFQDVNQVEPLALRAVAADFELGDFSNIRRAFGYTILLQPKQTVTRAEAAAVLWRFGSQTEGVSAADLRQES
ncbi:MAG: S-layer homology domain-containing protein [Leptolyngbya sp. RL_3_1]|nr:S-layer homology domain-containing protein [Leptolyngbya sp. RL_3_1]